MTFTQLCTIGWQAPTVGTGAKAAYLLQASAQRYANTVLEIGCNRPSKIRAAHRRYLRRRGLPLTPLAPSAKFRASGRVR